MTQDATTPLSRAVEKIVAGQADSVETGEKLLNDAHTRSSSALGDFGAGFSSHMKATVVGTAQLFTGESFFAPTASKEPHPESKARMAGEMVADAAIFIGTTAVLKRIPATSALAPIEAGGAIGFVAPLKDGEGFGQRFVHAGAGAGTMAAIEYGPKALAASGLIKSAETSIGGAIASGAVIGAATEQLNVISRTGHMAGFSQTAIGAASFGLTSGAFHKVGTILQERAANFAERSRNQDLTSIISSLPGLSAIPKPSEAVDKIQGLFSKMEAGSSQMSRQNADQGWHLVLGSGGSKAALTGAGVVLAARAASLKIETIGGVSGGFVPAALAASDMTSDRLLAVARETDISSLVRKRPIFHEVVNEHKRLDLLKDGLYDTKPLGEMVAGHMPEEKWPDKLWTMAVGESHSEVVLTSKGATEYTPEGQHILSSEAPSMSDAVRATSAIPGVLASMTMYGRRLYDGALGKFGKCPSDMATTHFGIPPERIIASLPTGAMTETNRRLYEFAKYLSGNGEHTSERIVEHAGIVVRPEVNSFHSLRFSLLPAQRDEAILAGYRTALEEFARNNLIKGIDLAQARNAGADISTLEAFFAPKPKFQFFNPNNLLRLAGPKVVEV